MYVTGAIPTIKLVCILITVTSYKLPLRGIFPLPPCNSATIPSKYCIYIITELHKLYLNCYLVVSPFQTLLEHYSKATFSLESSFKDRYETWLLLSFPSFSFFK